tara:strand:- start:262 stop:690 length:429 start_codon:yes stop_codon:yes gene_type:complete
MDPIQVLGKNDLRKEFKFEHENTAGQLLVKNSLNEERYARGRSKASKRIFINRKDSPVKNHFEGLPGWSRQDAVKAFDSDLWLKHQKNSIEKPVQDWFNTRVKELMAGHKIDLVDDVDHLEENDHSHGYSLKTYIEYLAKEI